MHDNEMQHTHRINIISVGAASLVLSLLSYRNAGFSRDFFLSVSVMFGATLLALGLYYVPIPDVGKGIVIVSLIGLATLLLSILQGGSDRNFIASFFVLALATLYFNSKIILGYGVIYMTACIGAAIVNPAYIDGAGYEMARVLIKLVIYLCVAVVLFLATRKGERIVVQSLENSRRVQENVRRSADLSAKLHSSIVNSNEGAASLSHGINKLKAETGEAKTDMKEALEQVRQMQEILRMSDMQMEQTSEYSQRLYECFSKVEENVSEGTRIVQSAVDAMEDTGVRIAEAHEATDKLLDKMERIQSILGEIDSVSQQTNILSINAAIEAARSGEYGKGFSVVANEVRDLAIQSAAASKKINGIVEELIAATNAVAAQVKDGDMSTHSSMEKMEQLTDCFGLLEESTVIAGKAVENENATMKVFRDEYKDMCSALERIAGITEQNAEMTNEIADNIIQQNQAVEVIALQMQEISGVSSQLNMS